MWLVTSQMEGVICGVTVPLPVFIGKWADLLVVLILVINQWIVNLVMKYMYHWISTSGEVAGATTTGILCAWFFAKVPFSYFSFFLLECQKVVMGEDWLTISVLLPVYFVAVGGATTVCFAYSISWMARSWSSHEYPCCPQNI